MTATFSRQDSEKPVPKPSQVMSEEDSIRQQSPEWEKPGKYWETYRPTPNVTAGINDVEGVVLHHTAFDGTAEQVVAALSNPSFGASCHVVIDKDGTRYVLAPPEAITWHAGLSKLGERFGANEFTVGIEFHGNTLEEPLTKQQIESAVEYLRPIIYTFNIPAEKIVTHQMIRDAYKEAMPGNKKVPSKVDVTHTEYHRVLQALDDANLLHTSQSLPLPNTEINSINIP